MVKSSSSQCSTEKTTLKKGAWSAEEDLKLINYIKKYKIWNWSEMSKAAGLARSGKSCRLRWVNYLRPDIKHGNFSKEEEETIMTLHETMGNRWSSIAAKLPGRTDNEVKNFWHTHLKKRLKPKASTISSSTVLATELRASKSSHLTDHEASPNHLEGLSNIIVESQPMSIDNLSPSPPPPPVIASSAPTNCEIGCDDQRKSDLNESIVVDASETTGQPESSCTQQVPIGNTVDVNAAQNSQATLFDAATFMGPSSSEAMWQQDSMWTVYDLYDGVCNDNYWLDYMDTIF